MRLIEQRIGLLFGAFLLCFLVVVGRAFWLQGVQGSSLASQAVYQQTEVVTVPGLRGDLLDRSGNTLATAAKGEALDLEGIGQLPDSRRTYPQGEMAGQVIGAVGSENEGLTGLE